MNLLDKQLEKIKKRKRIGLMAHVVVGYPNLSDTVEIVKVMEKCGVDIVELQIPFSDPLADGPTIMRACEQSLAGGTRVKDSFDVMRKLSAQVSTPLLFMSYYNPVFKYGVEKFCKDAKSSGASGVIVPDMPIEEENAEHFFRECQKNQLYDIRVISPASTDERLRKNAEVASGFIYCTAIQGTTGARGDTDPKIGEYLKKVKGIFDVPVAVGFGISNREQIKLIEPFADIAVVGSAVIDIINSTPTNKMEESIGTFFRELQVE